MPRRPLPPDAVLPVLVSVTAVVATYSVVRYRWWIVAAYLLVTLGLIAVQLSGLRRSPLAGPAGGARAAGPMWPWALALGLAALSLAFVHPYTYLIPAEATRVRWCFAGAALAAGVLLLVGARANRARAASVAAGVAVAGYLVAAVLLVLGDPAPRIDVWVTLQQGSEGLVHGANLYTQHWSDSPGVQDAFTYLPLTAVLVAPGRLLAGDVRWMLVLFTLLAALGLVRLGRLDGRAATGGAAAAVLLLMPGTATQVEQAWTEPLLLAALVGWAWAMATGRHGWAVVLLAVGLASKQHLVLVLIVLAFWPRFGLRRAVVAAVLAGAAMLPWFIASPADFLHDTVTVLVGFQPLVFADTVYIAAINELGWTPPFILTGALVLLTLVCAAWAVHRPGTDLPAVLRWCALLLLVANLVNKQAFYNQYWLVLALLLTSCAAPSGPLLQRGPGRAGVSSAAPRDRRAGSPA